MITLGNGSMKLVSGFITLTLAVAGITIAPGAFAQPRPAKPVQQIDIVRLDPRFDKLVPLNVYVERIVSGRAWVEGPLWNRREKYLLFSDIPTQYHPKNDDLKDGLANAVEIAMPPIRRREALGGLAMNTQVKFHPRFGGVV